MALPSSNTIIRQTGMVLLLCLMLVAPFPILSAEHAEAEAAIRIRDFNRAVEIYTQLAEQGDAEAQFALGGLYRAGRGVKKDYAKALHWYLKAANQEHPEAQYTTGTMYENGWGIDADSAVASEWYDKAAIQGHRLAKKRLENLSTTLPGDRLERPTGG